MRQESHRPNPKKHRDNLIEIFTAIDGADFAKASSFVKQYSALSQESLSKSGLCTSGIDFGLLEQAIQSLEQHDSDRARKVLVQFDIAICDALDNQSFLSKVMGH